MIPPVLLRRNEQQHATVRRWHEDDREGVHAMMGAWDGFLFSFCSLTLSFNGQPLLFHPPSSPLSRTNTTHDASERETTDRTASILIQQQELLAEGF